jgi:hypothetical protein
MDELKFDAGGGKARVFADRDFYELGRPVFVNGRSIRLFAIPEKHRGLIDDVLEKHVPEERCVSFIQFDGAAVFVGMLQGKLVPCVTPDVSTEETDAIAREFQLRLERFGT